MARPTVSVHIRFWPKIAYGKADECWLWQGHKDKNGYGLLMISSPPIKTGFAHRLMWTLLNGPIPDGLGVLHTCDNPACVNPRHLWVGTQAENVSDMDTKGRRVAKGPTPERSSGRRLTRDQVAQIRTMRATGASYTAIAGRFGIHKCTAARIGGGKTWR